MPRNDQDLSAALRDADRIARLMDTRFRIPGTGLRFGYDSIIGIVPGVGDTLTLAIGLAPVVVAHRAGAPAGVKARMLWHLGVDWLLSLPPVLGFALDALYKAHSKNAAILRAWVEQERRAASAGRPVTPTAAAARDRPRTS